MNKKVNKTTTRKEQLKLNAVVETISDNTDNSQSRSKSRDKKRLLTKHNHDLSGS